MAYAVWPGPRVAAVPATGGYVTAAPRAALSWADAPCVLGSCSRKRSSIRGSGARQHREDALDVVAELLHEVGEERPHRLVGDVAVVGDRPRREPEVGLGRRHLAGVAEAEHGS